MDEARSDQGGGKEIVEARARRPGLFGAGEAARRRAALLIALAVDALQIVVFPAFFPGIVSPFDNTLDVVTGIFMVVLLGWHLAFLPTFIAEVLPFVDLFPSWTLAVLFVTRKKVTSSPAADSPR
jgi:hypothetical protein